MTRIKSGTKEGAGYDPPALSARSLTVAVLYLQEKPSNRTATVRERDTKAGDPKSSLFRYPARSNNNCNRFELIVIRMPMVTN